METKELLLLIQTDSDSGLKIAIAEYGKLVKTIVSRVLYGRSQDVEECMADVFAALWKNSGRLLADDCSVKAWLCVIARNKAIDRYRSMRRSDMLPLDEDIISVLIDTGSCDEEDDIEEIIEKLPSPDHEIFLRKYYLLQTSEVIGKALNLTAQAVNMRLSRGRKQLRKHLIAMRPKFHVKERGKSYESVE